MSTLMPQGADRDLPTPTHGITETSKTQKSTPTEKALSNQLILTAIFRHIPSSPPESPLGTGHLLTLRLVSHAWNDFILSLPIPRVRFNLNPELPTRIGDLVPYRTLTALCGNFVSSKFVRSIFFQFKSRGPPITSHVRYIFSRFSAEIEFVSVHGMAEVGPFLHELFIQYSPNLRKLVVVIDQNINSFRSRVDHPVVTPSQTWLPVKPKLVTIHSIRADIEAFFASRTPAIPPNHYLMQAFLQTVVSAAPNLKVLVIRDALCPILPNGTVKLAKLRFDLYDPPASDRIVRPPSPGLSSLTQLLQAARNSLEELQLSATLHRRGLIDTLADGFTFPPEGMGKPETFKNWRIDVFKCDEGMSRRISAPTVIDADVVQILGVAPVHVSTATKVHLIGITSPTFLRAGFWTRFRHVQDLTVEIETQRGQPVDTILVELTAVVVALGVNLRFKRVTMISPFPAKLARLIDCLERFDRSAQPALRNLNVNASVSNDYYRTPRISKYVHFAANEQERLENVIVNLTKRCHMELSNCEFSSTMDQTIRSFVAQNKLDFTLREGDVHRAPPTYKYDLRGNWVNSSGSHGQ
ncbi:hypothetical protein Fcan01_17822 [Folsomia candida]|uniref:F-box domain-containing protein n=1 Tax=Folsomia candida TaxID=158441 RepID=A0A226DS66_FOLCA|nr:hypothetical protein Fcan01_17822 [Folsomia candida]